VSSRNRTHLLPALLIVVGLLALLVNLGAIPADRLYRLADLWPALLIVLGLVLLVNRARLPSAVDMTASVLIVVVAIAGAGLYVALGPPIPGGTHTITFSEPRGQLKQAGMELDVGASSLNVQGGSTSVINDLFQAQITYTGPAPTERVDLHNPARIVIQQNGQFGFFGGHQSIHIDIQLNAEVRWDLAIHSGASQDRYLLSTFEVGSMEIDTGASTEDIDLPYPSGTVPVTINGGALTVHLHRPSGTAASVKVSGGAVRLDFDGDVTSAVGSVSHSTEIAGDMTQVSVNGGTCNVTMDVAA
jgi:hypothetical protein